MCAQAVLPAINEASEVLGLRLKAVDKKSEKAVLAQVLAAYASVREHECAGACVPWHGSWCFCKSVHSSHGIV